MTWQIAQYFETAQLLNKKKAISSVWACVKLCCMTYLRQACFLSHVWTVYASSHWNQVTLSVAHSVTDLSACRNEFIFTCSKLAKVTGHFTEKCRTRQWKTLSFRLPPKVGWEHLVPIFSHLPPMNFHGFYPWHWPCLLGSRQFFGYTSSKPVRCPTWIVDDAVNLICTCHGSPSHRHPNEKIYGKYGENHGFHHPNFYGCHRLPSKLLQLVIVVIDFIVLFSTINPCRGVTGVSTHRWLGAWEVIDHRGLHSGGDAAILGAVCLAKSVSRMHSRSCTVSSHRYLDYTQIIYDIFVVHNIYIYIYISITITNHSWPL